MSFRNPLFFSLCIGLCLCLPSLNGNRYHSADELVDLIQYKPLAKGRRDAQPLHLSDGAFASSAYGGRDWLRKRSTLARTLPEQDQKALKAADLFLSTDHISLEQAMKKYNVSNKSSSSSHGSTVYNPSPSGSSASSRTPDSSAHGESLKVRPFSQAVLHRGTSKRPAKYETKDQFIARHAESLMKQGHTERNAITMAKTKVDQRNHKKANNLATWRHLADTDPSLARQMSSRVPTRLGAADYIPLRAHQLHHWGKAKGMEEATKMAKAESQKEVERKAQSHLKLKALRNQKAKH
ncbi:uncharacterized protein FA14DRAFT_153835 [Meira miltonrushii]|uniref:Uncharacterized protein n=1 Tax=Meira miltonrushii TaxID=1280837 RepID=A0A316VLP3_9BASI|nr:uncharacterized protein FA14DRAFT_153835 [Meira miltonrushii]PWN38512.1 hypothetical protein FA14DRAFT_153835 [Meira miltonrushii]